MLVDDVDDGDAAARASSMRFFSAGTTSRARGTSRSEPGCEVIVDHVDDDERASRGSRSDRSHEASPEIRGGRDRIGGEGEGGERLTNTTHLGAELGRRDPDDAVFDPFGPAGEGEAEQIGCCFLCWGIPSCFSSLITVLFGFSEGYLLLGYPWLRTIVI